MTSYLRIAFPISYIACSGAERAGEGLNSRRNKPNSLFYCIRRRYTYTLTPWAVRYSRAPYAVRIYADSLGRSHTIYEEGRGGRREDQEVLRRPSVVLRPLARPGRAPSAAASWR